MNRVIHVTTRADWEWARAGEHYGHERVDRDGFLHLCTPSQLAGVVDRHFGGARERDGLVGLVVDADALGDDLRWEPAPPLVELFPHLYRALEVAEVEEVRPVAELVAEAVPTKVVLAEKLASFEERWAPRIVAELNGQHVKLAKFEGEFLWHRHDEEDELFLVMSGHLRIEFRGGEVSLGPGELAVVPRGVEHRPMVDAGVAEVVLFEPASTLNTGNMRDERTREELERI